MLVLLTPTCKWISSICAKKSMCVCIDTNMYTQAHAHTLLFQLKRKSNLTNNSYLAAVLYTPLPFLYNIKPMQYAERKNYVQKVKFSPFWLFLQVKKSETMMNFTGFEESSKLEFQIYSIHKYIEPMLLKKKSAFLFLIFYFEFSETNNYLCHIPLLILI